MTIRKLKIIMFSVIGAMLLAFVIWIVWGNLTLDVSRYEVKIEGLPQGFSGFRIAHVSDLHNAEMGEGNEKLLDAIEVSNPDIIAITGDMIDSQRPNVAVALAFAEKAVKIAPCYYVTGNHESRTSEYESLKQGLIDLGVKVLENEKATIKRMARRITIIGVNDPAFSSGISDADIMQNKLHGLVRGEDYTVLLSHRPELFGVYVRNGVDLVLSGHAHGGQFRVPFLGGLVAPNQGLFPQYDGGVYKSGKTTMIVSRGIGNSAFPFRINNNPELVIVDLKR